jgi:hypothetical protein
LAPLANKPVPSAVGETFANITRATRFGINIGAIVARARLRLLCQMAHIPVVNIVLRGTYEFVRDGRCAPRAALCMLLELDPSVKPTRNRHDNPKSTAE